MSANPTSDTVDRFSGEVWQPVPVYDGRAELVATLVHIKEEENRFAYRAEASWKGLFLVERPDGAGRFKLWGTVPQALFDAEREAPKGSTLRGSLVAFSALVKQSPRDACFGYYKRPTKAEILSWGRNGRPAQ
jgi:hypothetical protein